MSTLLADLRFALRHFARRPAFTAVTVLTLALGLGVTVQLFSMVKGVVFRPVPGVEGSGEIQVLAALGPEGRPGRMSHPDFKDYRDGVLGFSSLAASVPVAMTLGAEGTPGERVWGELVSGEYFPMLGLQAQRGRLLTSEDDLVPGGHPVVVISDFFWSRRFDRDAGAVGQTIRLRGQPYTVVGVAPPEFRGSLTGMGLDLFVPLAMQRQVFPVGDLLAKRDSTWLEVKGRLAPGVSRAAAEEEARALAAVLAQRHPKTHRDRTVRIYDISANPLSGAVYLLPIAAILFALTLQILLVTAANVANLFQARLLGRRRELAVRQAQGATRGRLIRQLLTESLALSLAGGGVGLLLGLWLKEWIARRPVPTPLPTHFGDQTDLLVIGFVLTASLALGLILGLLPALRASRPGLLAALRGETGGREGKRQGSFLVITQVAFSLVPLICAGLFLRSFHNAEHMDPGFRTDDVLLATVERPAGEEGWPVYERVIEAAERLPGVEAAALAGSVPLGLAGSSNRRVTPLESAGETGEEVSVGYNVVSDGYFRALELPVLQGRSFTPEDDETRPIVVVVNRAFARRYWPEGEAVGKRLDLGSTTAQIVGVVADSQVERLGETPPPYFYLSYRQQSRRELTLHLVTSRASATVFEELTAALADVHPEIGLFDATSMDKHLETARIFLRALAGALAGGGLLSVLLAAAGLYGVMLQAVSRRTREIGVRMALGARRGDALRLILGRGLRWTAIGLALGTLMALAVSRFLRAFLLEVSPTDPLSFIGAALLLVAIAGLAAWLPARRAARIEPFAVLRGE